MTELFVSYDESLDLKELELDEQCLARYNVPGELITTGCYSDSHLIHLAVEQADICEAHILAPLWDQAFKFFRDKYNLRSTIIPYWISNTYMVVIEGKMIGESKPEQFNTYEEAELACLQKLIEICKKN